ncbi:MAG: cysteate synthase, partial [Deltaproteobacteria bacterium]|nr:cysteate synthase [Deltaproteobacteria bacterium]
MEARTDFGLHCLCCGAEASNGVLPLGSERCKGSPLLRTRYTKKTLSVGDPSLGIYRFADWLPVRRMLKGTDAPVTFKAERLGDALGLRNLYVTFSGYWPEKNVRMKTGTFKETEANAVGSWLPKGFDQTLVVASAGNTARAFAHVFSENKLKVVIVIPEQNLDTMWFDRPIDDDYVKLVAVGGASDYYDAIRLSRLITMLDGYIPEGGAYNVARRDGMATTVLSAVTTIGAIPDYYVQAIGSGTGTIAAWEANLRFIAAGQYEPRKMTLLTVLNAPFCLIYDSWKSGSRELAFIDEADAKAQIGAVYAKVLSNRRPAYGMTGGLYDALVDTGGDVLLASNEEAMAASAMFLETEGNDLAPPTAVALAGLIGCVNEGRIERDAIVMLNA